MLKDRHTALRQGAALCLGIAWLGLAGCGGGERPESAAQGLIAYEYKAPGANRVEIWTVDGKGKGARRLISDDGGSMKPAWSPEQKKIAYVVEAPPTAGSGGERSSIYVASADGSGAVRLTASRLDAMDPAWSPNGRQIAFAASEGKGDPDIYVMSSNGSNVRRLTRSRSADDQPTWTPDGKLIVFSSLELTSSGAEVQVSKYRLFSVPLDGGARSKLPTESDCNLDAPEMSPDGKWLAYWEDCGAEGGGLRIRAIAPNGAETKYVQTRYRVYGETWSPDSKQLVLGGDTLTVVDVATGKETKALLPPEQPASSEDETFRLMPAWAG